MLWYAVQSYLPGHMRSVLSRVRWYLYGGDVKP
jgi:hypothetical protein